MTIAETARRVLQAPAIDLPAVFFFAGVIVCFFGAAMLLPAIVDLAQDDDDYRVFVMCSAITMFGGLSLVLAFRQRRYAVGVREVMLLVPATWIAVVAFSALPFAFSSFPLSYTDAVFEAMSGIAAVGSTVIIGLDEAPMGILLWRWLLIWLGGFGIITLAVLVLPFLRIGGMQLFVLDLSAQTGKFVPRMPDLVIKIGLVYVGLTAFGAIAFRHRGHERLRCRGPRDVGGGNGRLLLPRRGVRLFQESGHRVDRDADNAAVGNAVCTSPAGASSRSGRTAAG